MAQLSRATLAKILGRMGSDQDGEALSAARMATKLVREAGLTWDHLLAGPVTTSTTTAFHGSDAPVAFGEMVMSPPYGHRWLDTVRHLLDERASQPFILAEQDRLWLRAMPGRLAKRTIHGHEAANLWRVWDSAHRRFRDRQEAAV